MTVVATLVFFVMIMLMGGMLAKYVSEDHFEAPKDVQNTPLTLSSPWRLR